MAAEAAPPPLTLAQWRKLFGSQVFDALDAAVAIAARDDPAGLRQRRDRIMQLLYAPPAAIPGGTAKKEGAAPVHDEEAAPRIAKIRVAAGKKEERAPVPTSKALGRPETAAAAVLKASMALAPCPRVSAADSTPSARASKAEALPAASMEDMEAKLAATKRKLREGYEEAADKKRQHRIQVIAAPEEANQRTKPDMRVYRKVCAASAGAGRRAVRAPSPAATV